MAMPAVTEAAIALFADLRPVGRPPRPPDPGLAEFRDLLRGHLAARRWSQMRAAAESDMDHSLVSRLLAGSREPTREAIRKLATGLGLAAPSRDELLMAAGYLPDGIDPDHLRRAVALIREVSAAELTAARALIDAARRV